MDVIVELRAGLMALRDGRLSADPRKGLIRVCQDEMGLTHFCWAERDASGAPASAEPEQDIVIIPGECTFSKIARPGARVFELRFPAEKQRNMFFWAQDPDASTDEDYVAAINHSLTMTGQEEEEEEEGAGGAAGPEAMEAEAAPGVAPAAAGGNGGGGAGAGGAIGAADLAAILGSIMSGGAGAGAGGGAALARLAQAQRAAVDPGPTLGDVLKPEALAPLLRDPDMVQRLAPFLPEQHRSAGAIVELVSTPQFRHQLDLLSHALMTGQLDTRQFGLPPGGFGVLDFLRGIQQQADKERTAGQGEGQAQQEGGGGAGPEAQQ